MHNVLQQFKTCGVNGPHYESIENKIINYSQSDENTLHDNNTFHGKGSKKIFVYTAIRKIYSCTNDIPIIFRIQ